MSNEKRILFHIKEKCHISLSAIRIEIWMKKLSAIDFLKELLEGA